MAYNINNLPSRISIGKKGERNATKIEFDITDWLIKYPNGTYYLTYTRPNEPTVNMEIPSRVYPNATYLIWKPSPHAVYVNGEGTVVVGCSEDGVLKKTAMFRSEVLDGHTVGEAPDPISDWIVDMVQHIAMIDAAEQARITAEQGRVDAELSRMVWEHYDNIKAYLEGNKVYYSGSSYVCIEDTLGNLPTDESYWLMIARQGATFLPTFRLDNGELIANVTEVYVDHE